MFAVQVQRHRLGLHAEGDLVPVAVKQVVDSVVLEHGPHGVLRQAHGVVLHRFVLSVQTDGHLSSRGEEGRQPEELEAALERESRGI